MENALLIGLSRQTALKRKMDVIANNLANMRTSGYKAESMQFEDYIPTKGEGDSANGFDGKLHFVQDVAVIRDYSEGSFTQTGNALDVAINGKGWLVVQTPDGERYTRHGNLKLNPNGTLVTSDNQPVLGGSGPITIDSEDTNLLIADDGTISSDAGQKGKLRVVQFENENELKKQGGNLYVAEGEPQPATNFKVAQGMVEDSNVKPVQELSQMIEVSRAYISTARMLDKQAELRSKAIRQLGTLPN